MRKLFNRMLGLEKGRWVVKQDFQGNFRVNVTCFFAFFLRSSGLNRAHSGMDEKISSPCSSQRTKLSLTVQTDDDTSGRRGVDPHGRLWTV